LASDDALIANHASASRTIIDFVEDLIHDTARPAQRAQINELVVAVPWRGRGNFL